MGIPRGVVNRYGLSDSAVAALAAFDALREVSSERRALPPGADATGLRKEHRFFSQTLVAALSELDRQARMTR